MSRQTWLRRAEDPRLALLQDFVPRVSAAGSHALTPGQWLQSAVAHYPSRYPVRAVLADADADADAAAPRVGPQSPPAADVLAAHRSHLGVLPWAEVTPITLGKGRFHLDGGRLWWRDRTTILPTVSVSAPEVWAAVEVTGGAALWDGVRLTPLMVRTPFGAGFPDA